MILRDCSLRASRLIALIARSGRGAALIAATAFWCAGCQESTPPAAPPASAPATLSQADEEPLPALSDPPATPAPSPAGNAAESVSLPEGDAAEQPIETVAAESRATVSHGESVEQPPEPLLEDWEKPLLAIVLTGEQHGHLEPCGCSERQSGGLARRTDFVRQLQERGWDVTGFDLGGTLKRSRRQSEMKFEYTRDALNIMGYKGLGLGPEELKLGVLKLFESFSGKQGEDDFDVPFISANVTLFGDRSLGTPLEYRVVEVGGVTVGVTSVIGPTYLKKMFPPGSEPDPGEILIESIDDVLPDVIRRMNEEMPQGDQPSVTILLSHATPEESGEIAQKYPGFDLVVTAGSPEDPDGRTEQVGDTLLLKVGEKGKHAGLVGLYPGRKFRFTTVELDRFRFGHAPQIDQLMVAYQQLLEQEDLIGTEPSLRHAFGEGYTYLGSEKCADCHDAEYEIWKNSPHSHAYDSLTVAYALASDDPSIKERMRVDRIYDPECINCHTTGWDPQDVIRFDGGFTGADRTPHLMGVNCENCHGPASRHVDLEEAGAADELLMVERAKMHLDESTAEVQLCIKCHDYENSPDFKFETYWPQIEH